jgi:hypothetical protein
MKKFLHRITGRRSFRVRYYSLDVHGHRPVTRRMTYHSARNYCEIFSGEVIFDPSSL